MFQQDDITIQDILDQIKQQEIEDSQLINLNANENQLSNTARSMLSSRLSQRYNLTTTNHHAYSDIVTIDDFTFKGIKCLYALEAQASSLALELFSASACEFRFLSGIHAMFCSIVTFSQPGDIVYAIDYRHGGHFATGFVVERFGRKFFTIPVDSENCELDLSKLKEQFEVAPPKLIYLDMGCPIAPIPLKELRGLVPDDCIIIYDASHTLGLIAGGVFQQPLKEGADILQGNTHKTFPGPQKALMVFKNKKHASMMSTALDMGLISNRHNHHDMALFITIMEMYQFGKDYAKQILANTHAFESALLDYGFEFLTEKGQPTKSHILLLKGESVGDYIAACSKLLKSNICTNSRRAFGHEIIRIGTQEVTRRGMKESDMQIIAGFFKKLLKDNVDVSQIKSEVIEFNHQFKHLHYSFDSMTERDV